MRSQRRWEFFIFLITAFMALAFTMKGLCYAEHDHFKKPNMPNPTANEDYYDNGNPPAAKVELGRLLFYDKLLSGNKNISCATCHHSLLYTGDGLSLPVGEGGRGLGVTRDTGVDEDAIKERVPRNAPPVFNLGAKEFTVMFHDGRLAKDDSQPSGFMSPAKDVMPTGLDNVLAAQAMFPVTSAAEMAGQAGENDIADAAAQADPAAKFPGVWGILAERLKAVDEYVDLFNAAYGISKEQITYVHAANAIAAFEAKVWRADNSHFDRYLRGDSQAMNKAAHKGVKLFYGKAGCFKCHSGIFQTDLQFHAIAMPQIGPGRDDETNQHQDTGRDNVTADSADRFKFRTPSLRNIALTAPYGHDGAYNTLEGVVRHHLDTVAGLNSYDTSQATLPPREDLNAIDFAVHNNPTLRNAIASANELEPVELSDKEFMYLMEFLLSLTDPASIDLRKDVPQRVPSGLVVFD